MPLSGLLVLHRCKGALTPGALPPCPAGRPAFRLETCLRELWIHDSRHFPASQRIADESFEIYRGNRAYELLLRIGCGLDSQIKGESDVFGQLRDAWRVYEKAHPVYAGALGPLMQRVFEDVKEIRSRHLRSLGSTTYGGLTRTLLGDEAKRPTLLIGAGRMAQAVLPYLAGEPVSVWNRNATRVGELLATLPTRHRDSIQIVPATAADEMEAWHAATNVVLCIPADVHADPARIAAWQSRDRARGRVLHLGLLGAEGSPWHQLPRLATLKELFGLQARHNGLRDAHLARAAAACHEKAALRSLGGPLSLAHGWEDLSLFASTG